MKRLTPDREQEIRTRDTSLPCYTCNGDELVDELFSEIDALKEDLKLTEQLYRESLNQLRAENERLSEVPIKWNEDCYQLGYDDAKQENQKLRERVAKFRSLLEAQAKDFEGVGARIALAQDDEI